MYFFGVSQTTPAESLNEKSASICILRSGTLSSVSHSVCGSPEKLPCDISGFCIGTEPQIIYRIDRGGSAVQAPLSRKRMSISRTVSDLTGKIQSAGVERQSVVEHLRCNARRPLVPLRLRFGGLRLHSCRWCNRPCHQGSSMVGLYRSVAKP